MVARLNSWFNATRVAFIALCLNVLCIIYVGIVQNNDLKNTVKVHDEKINKIELSLEQIDNKKLDKETFNFYISTMTDIKVDIRDIKNDLKEHINLSTGRR